MEDKNPGQDFDFMKEKIKDRPINRKKLLRRTITTASMAVVFGLVACLTFLVLEPVFSNWLYPEEEPAPVVFPEEKDEMLPEDMLVEESEEDETETAGEPEPLELEVADYQLLYDKLYMQAQESSRSVVTVTGVTSDMDWFNNPYESRGKTSGVIVANNGKEYVILVDKKPIETVEKIQVLFHGGIQAAAELKKIDQITGLAVITVDVKALTQEEAGEITVATLGSSNNPNALASPVMALGSPYGTGNSVAYGMITSMGNVLHLPDSSYKLLMTDIYTGTDASGVLMNMRGQVIGMISQKYNDEDMANQVCAIGISELKNTIERLSAGQTRPYVGIYGTDVTKEAEEELKVPMGAYVTEIELESPAMKAGIQSGDIITSLNGAAVNSYGDYISQLGEAVSGENIEITVMRQGQDEYREIEISVAADAAE